MVKIEITTKPIRAGQMCEVKVSGTANGGTVPVVISLNGKVVARINVKPPIVLNLPIPHDTAGMTLRVSTTGDFDTGFILAS